MFRDNLVSLRKMHNMTQEALAEQLGITRQTLSKWETGESLPDIEKCMQIAKTFDIPLDELVSESSSQFGLKPPPREQRVFGLMKVGGTNCSSARARKIFNIQPGDHLILLGDENSGLALIKSDLPDLSTCQRTVMTDRMSNALPRAGNNKRQHILCRARICCPFLFITTFKKFMNQTKKNVRIPWLLVTAVFLPVWGLTRVANILPIDRPLRLSAATTPRKVGGEWQFAPRRPLVAMQSIAMANQKFY